MSSVVKRRVTKMTNAVAMMREWLWFGILAVVSGLVSLKLREQVFATKPEEKTQCSQREP